MAPFDECSVLIPAATLEDFPSDVNDSDARSLLAGWTVLWHPRLLAQTEQLPTWYRADSPPEPDGPRIVVAPNSSIEQLPSGYRDKCLRNNECQWVVGDDRDAMLRALDLDAPPELNTDHRTIGVQDFFAAGYASLQTQIMTRRLRYTSNLDEIHLQKQVVEAAKAFLSGDASAAASALHNVFDCLAEERDHYFSSDPHLVDLTLLTPSTLDQLIESRAMLPCEKQEHAARLETPQNVLIDDVVARDLVENRSPERDEFCSWLAGGKVGWAGGSPPVKLCFDAMTFSDAESEISAAHQLATSAIGKPPAVYSRFTGSTPLDLTPALVRLGYAGIIPIDFARGTGYGDEAKVMQQSGGAEIESLTAKPMDAASDSAFLNLGAKLGEAIDSGEIATALLAHWPNQSCDSFKDLRCVASWSLVLGRFWNLEQYFREGESPYHHGNTTAVASDSYASLDEKVTIGTAKPISTTANDIQESVAKACTDQLRGMTDLVSGKPGESESALSEQFAKATGATPATGDSAKLIVNSAPISQRCLVDIDGNVSDAPKHIFGVSGNSKVSVDVPACGFAVVAADPSATSNKGFFKRLMGNKSIADGTALQNEFMEVAVSPETGGVQGVYSGGVRGNRFSMRLVCIDETSDKSPTSNDKQDDPIQMRCKSLRVVESSEAVGVIEVSGEILDDGGKVSAEFKLQYRLERGSRWLSITGDIVPKVEFFDQPWKHYIAARAVVASESAITRAIVRDKLHRVKTRRIVAPLGVVLDEAERQTLVGAKGLAYHRRVGDRFLDTLLAVKGESSAQIDFAYGFDQPNAVGSAKSLFASPQAVSIEPNSSLPETGWITHVSPREAMINRLAVAKRNDELLAAVVRVIQTRNKSASLAVRFCRDVLFATTLESDADETVLNQPLPSQESQDEEVANVGGVKFKGDTVRLPTSGHQVTDLLVVFKA